MEKWEKDFITFYRVGDAKASAKLGLQTITLGYGATLLIFPTIFPVGTLGLVLSIGVGAVGAAHDFLDNKDSLTVSSYFGAQHLEYRTNYTLNQWNGKKQLGTKEKGLRSYAYLGCEYYDNDNNVSDDWWEWVNKDNMAHLVPPREDGKTHYGNLSYYGENMQLQGRWISVPTEDEDVWVFGTNQNPATLAGLCLEIVKNKILETRDEIEDFDPKNVKVAVGDYLRKHEIIYYARDKELSARKKNGKIYYSQVNFER